jgi:hypothetical protein
MINHSFIFRGFWLSSDCVAYSRTIIRASLGNAQYCEMSLFHSLRKNRLFWPILRGNGNRHDLKVLLNNRHLAYLFFFIAFPFLSEIRLLSFFLLLRVRGGMGAGEEGHIYVALTQSLFSSPFFAHFLSLALSRLFFAPSPSLPTPPPPLFSSPYSDVSFPSHR